MWLRSVLTMPQNGLPRPQLLQQTSIHTAGVLGIRCWGSQEDGVLEYFFNPLRTGNRSSGCALVPRWQVVGDCWWTGFVEKRWRTTYNSIIFKIRSRNRLIRQFEWHAVLIHIDFLLTRRQTSRMRRYNTSKSLTLSRRNIQTYYLISLTWIRAGSCAPDAFSLLTCNFDNGYEKVIFTFPYRFNIDPTKNKQKWIQQAHLGYLTYHSDLTDLYTIPPLKLTWISPWDKSHTNSAYALDIR